MRIGMFLDHYPEPDGTTTAVRGLAQALSRRGIEVTILCQGPESSTFDEAGLAVQVFRRPASSRFGMPSRRLRSALDRNVHSFDLVILNGMFSPWLPLLARSARRGGIPVIVAPHGPYHDNLFARHNRLKRVYWRLVERPFLSSVEGIQVLATSQGAILEGRGIGTSVLIVPNGVNRDEVDPSHPNGPIGESRITIGHAGRIAAWHKGLDVLVEEFALARADVPQLHLDIRGSRGNDRESIVRLVRDRGLQDSVKVDGLAEGSAAGVIRGWDALVVASRFDGFPQTALEAMLAERPVLCSREAGVWEYIRDAGCGLPLEPTPEGIRRAILEFVARRSEWQAMGLRGRKFVEHHLTWDHVAATALRQYEEVIGLEAARNASPIRDRPAA